MEALVEALGDDNPDVRKSSAQALAEEIIEAYEFQSTSTAIAKKRDIERQADSSR